MRAKRAYAAWAEKNPKIVREPTVTADGMFCRSCSTRKPFDQFYRSPDSKSRAAFRCKQCARECHKAWRDANREHIRDYARGTAERLRRKNPEKYKAALARSRLKRQYGLTEDGLQAMYDSQGGRCAICKAILTLSANRKVADGAHIDHCHRTGKTRALLCRGCNSGLGQFREDAAILAAAISYLSAHHGPPGLMAG